MIATVPESFPVNRLCMTYAYNCQEALREKLKASSDNSPNYRFDSVCLELHNAE